MQDNKNLAIGVLSITATILFAAFLIVTIIPTPQVRAIGQTDRGGDYIVVTGQFTNSSELVYVTDAAANRLHAYTYDWGRRSFILWDSHDLNREFGKGNAAPARRN